MRRLRSPLLIIALLITLVTPTVASLQPAAAIDILNTCSNTARTASEKKNCTDCKGSGADTTVCKDSQSASTTNPIVDLIKIVINVVSYIGGAAAVIALVVNGLRMILSNGDSNAISSARSGVLYALVGIIVIVLAQSIVVFILNKI